LQSGDDEVGVVHAAAFSTTSAPCHSGRCVFALWLSRRLPSRIEAKKMFPKPKPALTPNTYDYESQPLVKPTGFRKYDARWLLGSEINQMGLQALGLGLGTLIHGLGVKPEIVTGHDFRGYSAAVKT